MFNNVLKKVQNTLNEGIKNVKMIVNTLNESRPVITIHDKSYYLDELIAEGGYALIYKIQSVSDDKFLALKKINIQSSSHKKQIKREIKIWKELSKFSNIVELVDFELTERHAYVVMELCEEGTLLDFVNNHEGNISEVEALLIFNQILLGVNAMHSQKPPIAHRDLKIENILKQKRNYKICDFGSATDEIFDPTTSDEFVKEQNFSNFEKHSTLYYRAPEMCDRYGEYPVSEKVDIWSLGCVLYTMVFKEQPFMNAQKLEIINGNYNFPKDEQKLYSEKFLDLIRVMLTPNPKNRPNVIQIMEWTNYWNETKKIPLSQEVEEIKQKQIKSGGIKNKSHKKKLLTAEEIEKIQSKIKSKEKKKKNYDDINELFGFAKNDDKEEDQKEEVPKQSNFNDDLFAVFSGAPQNKNTNEEKKSKIQNNDDLLDMQFYEVDESKQENNTKNKKIENTNLNNDLNAIFGNPSPSVNTNTNNNKKEENKNNFDLLFSSTNENIKEKKSEDNNNLKKTELNDLLNAINNENKKDNSNNKDLFNMNSNNGNKNITYKMNGQDFFSNFEPSEPPKKAEDDLFTDFNKPQKKPEEKKEEKPSKLEDDLFAAFSQPKEKPAEKTTKEEINKQKIEDDLFATFNQPLPKKEEEKKQQKLEDDLFAAFNQPQTKPKEEKKKEEKKKNMEEDLFAAFNQPQIKPKEEEKKEEKKKNMEDDLFAAFSQPQNKPKEEEKKEEKKKNVEDDLFAAFSQPQIKPKEEGKKEEKKKNVEDLFAEFNQPQIKPKEEVKKEEKKKNVEDDLFAAFNQPENKPKEEEKKEKKNKNLEDDLFAAFSQPPTKAKEDSKKEENNDDDKKAIKNNIEFDLFNFNNTSSKNTVVNTENQNKSKDNNFDLLFTLNSNTNKENGGENIENGQTQPKINEENKNDDSASQNKSQDIFGFFK